MTIYTLTSELHDAQAVDASTKEFLGSLNIPFELKGSDYSDYGSHPLDVIYVRTGGTEGIFKRLLPQLQAKSKQPFYLLTSGKSNSLAASMEILAYLQQNSQKGAIIHGSPAFISKRLDMLEKVCKAKEQLKGCKLGVIGQPSDWLIASEASYQKVRETIGLHLEDIAMEELLNAIKDVPADLPGFSSDNESIQQALTGAQCIYEGLKCVITRHSLQGLTLRCFDLLTAVRNTGCLALARLNAEGLVAGCEGDVPAMLSMMIVRSLLGISGFQANPASINPESGEMLFAHCTIPLNMVERYELDTHFESGIGVGIRGFMKEGPVTIFKVSGDLSRHFVAQGQLICNQSKPDLCRTQQVIRLDDKRQTDYFLNNPIGNHHIIIPGHHQDLLEEFLK